MMRKRLILSFLVCLFLLASCRRAEVFDTDKEMFVRAKDFAEYGFSIQNAEKYESFEKINLFDGSQQIEYEFETPENESANSLYLIETVTIDTNQSDAKMSKGVEDTGISIGLKIGGIEKEEVKDFYKYGDSSNFYALKKDGKKVGNYFSTRHGKNTFSLFIVGLYVDDVETWREIVEPRLKKFSAYKPK